MVAAVRESIRKRQTPRWQAYPGHRQPCCRPPRKPSLESNGLPLRPARLSRTTPGGRYHSTQRSGTAMMEMRTQGYPHLFSNRGQSAIAILQQSTRRIGFLREVIGVIPAVGVDVSQCEAVVAKHAPICIDAV